VAFGGVWKASLTELSGGQRSLLALSLILAMLLFKPAPIYILDEARSRCMTDTTGHCSTHLGFIILTAATTACHHGSVDEFALWAVDGN